MTAQQFLTLDWTQINIRTPIESNSTSHVLALDLKSKVYFAQKMKHSVTDSLINVNKSTFFCEFIHKD